MCTQCIFLYQNALFGRLQTRCACLYQTVLLVDFRPNWIVLRRIHICLKPVKLSYWPFGWGTEVLKRGAPEHVGATPTYRSARFLFCTVRGKAATLRGARGPAHTSLVLRGKLQSN